MHPKKIKTAPGASKWSANPPVIARALAPTAICSLLMFKDSFFEVTDMKKRKVSLTSQYKLVAHGIMLCTILATIMLVIHPRIAMTLFTIGATSGWVAFGFATAEATPYILGLVAFVWCFAFPILLLIAYILAIKKKYIPFCMAVTCDSLFVIAWVIYSTITGNFFGVQSFLIDVVVSLMISIILVRITYLLMKDKRSAN